MSIELYEYGIEQSLDAAVKILRGALGTSLSKKDKDLRIREAVGIIDTLQWLLVVKTEDGYDFVPG
jgi:hypothetical protein